MLLSLLAVAILMLVPGRGNDDNSSASTAKALAVTGTSTCQFTPLPGGTADDGAEVINERFTCINTMSDPRVSGTEVLEIETLIYEGHSAPWTVKAGTITNDEGSWRGTGAGVLRFDLGVPYNYGEMIYTGEGAYAGLTYHYLVAGSNEELVIAGWIEPAEPFG